MMKTLQRIAAVLLIVIVLLFLGLVIFLKTLDLNRFKDRITRQIGASLGRDAAMRHISFNFSVVGGAALDISGFSVMDHPAFSTEPMFYVDAAHLDIDLLSLVFKREILVSRVELNSPKLNLIRNSAGEINLQQFKRPAKSETENGKKDVPAAPAGPLPGEASKKETKSLAFGTMLVRAIRVTDGAFIFTDRTASPPVTIPVTRLELQVSNLSLDAPFPFEAGASLWSGRRNIGLKGLARIDAGQRQVRVDDLKMQTDLSELSPERIYEGVPALKEAGFKGGTAGRLAVDIHQAVVGGEGLLALSSEGRLSDGKVQFDGLPVPVERLNMRFEMTESDAVIKEAAMPLASGELRMSGRIMDYPKEQRFLAELVLNDVRLSELTAQMDFPAKVEGRLYGSFKVNGKGMNEDALKASLAGEGTVGIKEGRVADVNLLKLVLSKISFIPNLVSRIEENLPDTSKEKLKAKDTILEKAEMDARIRDRALRLNRAELNADGFLVTAAGRLDFEQNLSLEAGFTIPADLSAGMAAAVPELGYFLDDRGRIHIPFKPYTGKLARLRMYPDVEDLGKEIIRNRGKEELKKVIFKALDLDGRSSGEEEPRGEGPSPAQPAGDGDATPPPEREPSPEEVIIENILDMIPVFK